MLSQKTLQDFLLEEITRRDISIREFSRVVGVAHATIVRAMSPNPPEPTLDFLSKLARATETDICTLVALVYPNDVTFDGEARALAQQISQLPPEDRQLLETFFRGLLLKSKRNSE